VFVVSAVGTDVPALAQSPRATFSFCVEIDADVGGVAGVRGLRRRARAGWLHKLRSSVTNVIGIEFEVDIHPNRGILRTLVFAEVCNEVRPNCSKGKTVDMMPACEVLDVNENSCANSSVVYVEEGPNGSIRSEGVNDESELGEILFEGRALIDSGDRATGV